MHTAAKGVSPEVAKRYMANRNRRKSTMTLPLILLLYDVNDLIIRYLA